MQLLQSLNSNMSLMQTATEIWQSVQQAAPKNAVAIAGATFVSISAAVWWYRRRYDDSAPPGYKSRKDLVSPPGLPLLGNFHQLTISKIITNFENWAW